MNCKRFSTLLFILGRKFVEGFKFFVTSKVMPFILCCHASIETIDELPVLAFFFPKVL
jgi:hypothetical protein